MKERGEGEGGREEREKKERKKEKRGKKSQMKVRSNFRVRESGHCKEGDIEQNETIVSVLLLQKPWKKEEKIRWKFTMKRERRYQIEEYRSQREREIQLNGPAIEREKIQLDGRLCV